MKNLPLRRAGVGLLLIFLRVRFSVTTQVLSSLNLDPHHAPISPSPAKRIGRGVGVRAKTDHLVHTTRQIHATLIKMRTNFSNNRQVDRTFTPLTAEISPLTAPNQGKNQSDRRFFIFFGGRGQTVYKGFVTRASIRRIVRQPHQERLIQRIKWHIEHRLRRVLKREIDHQV